MAYENIPSGTVVCDYHAQILEWQLGHAKYKNNTSDNNTYMFAVQDGSNRFYLDATDEHCLCHPTTKLKGRLINHSVNGNLKPVINYLEGKPILLLVASRDIAECEDDDDELEFNDASTLLGH